MAQLTLSLSDKSFVKIRREAEVRGTSLESLVESLIEEMHEEKPGVNLRRAVATAHANGLTFEHGFLSREEANARG